MEDKEFPKIKTENIDIETLLREKEKIDSLIKRKFTKEITVMFTDLSGSTQMSEELGDLAMRAILKKHHDIIRPIVETTGGVLVKTMGDGTMSYFDDPKDAIRAAIQIQTGIHNYNQDKGDPALLIRCGLNTGLGIVEKSDVYGDVVNVAQRYEAMATAREILMSTETFTLVKDCPEFTLVFLKEVSIKGKGDTPKKVFKVLWDREDIERYEEAMEAGEMETFVEGKPGEFRDMSGAAPLAPKLPAKLMVEQKGKTPITFELTKEEMIIGRSSKSDIQLPEVYISRRHARLVKEGGAYYVEDLESNIGTVFKGQKIKRQELKHGDELSIGSVRLVFLGEQIVTEAPEDTGEQKKPHKITHGLDNDATQVIDRKKVFTISVFEGATMVAKHELRDMPLLVGRVNECDIRLGNPAVSREHARIYTVGETVIVEDLKSNNGTYVNGSSITKLDVGMDDEIRVGPFTIFVVDPDAEAEWKKKQPTLAEKMLSFLNKR